MNTRHILLVCIFWVMGFALSVCNGEEVNTIPAQADMKAEVIVSGHTSTEKNIDVVNIGKQIPRTFGGPDLANVDGFTWYVSKHFALRTDYPETEAIHKLKLLEMAYPHYVEFVGEPPDILNKRVAVVFGSSYQATTSVMMADDFERGPNGGGEAMYYNNVAYCFPAGEYHNRYILLHETGHAFQFAACGRTHSMPGWYVEGFADGISDHIYEPDLKRITFFVLNTWGGHDWFRDGLQSHSLNPSWPGGSRGQNVLAVQFFMNDPMRFSKFMVWQDEMFRIDPEGDNMIHSESDRLLYELFGSSEALKQTYITWMNELKPVIQLVEGPWKLGVADYSITDTRSDRMNRIILNLPPGERMDKIYRSEKIGLEPTPLIGAVECGVTEPVVGCLIDYTAVPAEKSKVGLGLGVINVSSIDPFRAGMLYADQACEQEGINVEAYRLKEIVSGGALPENVVNGELIGRSVDSEISLGLKGSSTDGLTENFVIEWDGWLKVPENETYVFATRSDDGSWLWIDNNLIVNNGGYHGSVDKTGYLALSRGIHRIRARFFFQGGGPFNAEVGLIDNDEKPGSLDLMISGGTSFVVEGELLGVNRQELPIPDDVVFAFTTGVCRAGITAKLLGNELRVELRVENKRPGDEPVLQMSVPLTASQRERLVDRPIALLARQTSCGLNAYMDESQRYYDLSIPAPANPWRSEAYNALRRVAKACWRLKNDVPSSLVKMRRSLYDAVQDGKKAREKSLQRFNSKLSGIMRDITRTGSEYVNPALIDLAGFSMELIHDSNETRDVVAVMRNNGNEPVNGMLAFNVLSANGLGIAAYTNNITIPARDAIRVKQNISCQHGDEDHMIEAVARFRKFGNPILRAETTRWPDPWLSMGFDPAYSFAGSTGVTGRVIFTGPIQMAATGNVTFRVKQKDAVESDEMTQSVTVRAGEKIMVPFFFKWKNNNTPVSVEAEAHVLHINEQIMLKDVLEIDPNVLP